MYQTCRARLNAAALPIVDRRPLMVVAACGLALLAAAPCRAQSAVEWGKLRTFMVEQDVAAAGVKSPGVLAAMRGTPRHEFVASKYRKLAYFDMALPIGEGQTISPPFIVAKMTERLDPLPTDKVLEIGTGSGYQAAVLSGLVKEVYTIEIVEPLGRKASETLTRLGYKNVKTKIGDGYKGWSQHAPFDKIIVTCSPENVPEALVEQLREGGRMLIPLGERYQQTLYLMKKVNGELVSEALEPTFFVPMTGAAEDSRTVKPNATLTSLVNGDFEQVTDGSDQPAGWYYVRQAAVSSASDSRRGHCLTFTNSERGRGSQALQALGIDGRKVRQLDVGAWLRAEDLRPGIVPDQKPKLLLTFFDDSRAPIGQEAMGPWSGSFDWKHETARVKVPKSARTVIVAIGLLGATGELSLDQIAIQPTSGK